MAWTQCPSARDGQNYKKEVILLVFWFKNNIKTFLCDFLSASTVALILSTHFQPLQSLNLWSRPLQYLSPHSTTHYPGFCSTSTQILSNQGYWPLQFLNLEFSLFQSIKQHPSHSNPWTFVPDHSSPSANHPGQSKPSIHCPGHSQAMVPVAQIQALRTLFSVMPYYSK